jgi:hypothetical protein
MMLHDGRRLPASTKFKCDRSKPVCLANALWPPALFTLKRRRSTTSLSSSTRTNRDMCSRPSSNPPTLIHNAGAMGFNKRKMENARRQEAEKEAAARRVTDRQILENAEQLVTAWNERQAKRMPMLFSPTIGAAITAGYWFLRARCPACRTTGAVDLRRLDWHRGAAVTALIPSLSCRSCRPNAPFAQLVCLSESSVAEEYYAERSGNRWISE